MDFVICLRIHSNFKIENRLPTQKCCKTPKTNPQVFIKFECDKRRNPYLIYHQKKMLRKFVALL